VNERERMLLIGILARLDITEDELRAAVEETAREEKCSAEERAGLMRAVGLCRPTGKRLSG